MSRSRAVPAGIAVAGLLLGSLFMETVGGSADAETRAIVEATGFAISTPGGLVVLAYFADEFEFGRYFDERSGPALVGDFLLSVLAATAVGLPATALATRVTDSPLLTFLVSGFAVFTAAFGVFAARTRPYFEVAPNSD